MSRSLKEMVDQFDQPEDEKYTFDKMASELSVERIDISNSEAIDEFTSSLIKQAAAEKPEATELNVIEKIAEFVMIADLLSKQSGGERK